MNVLEALRVAFSGLASNRLRSGLTMLGILIGVGAVILLVAVGNGTTARVQSQIQSLGTNLIYVYPSATRGAGGVSQGFGSGQTLTQQDVDALNDKSQAPHVVTAIPVTGIAGTMTYQNQNWFAQASGSTQQFDQVRDYQLATGNMFTASDVTDSARVVVIGQTVVDNLFNGDPGAAVGSRPGDSQPSRVADSRGHREQLTTLGRIRC